MAHRGIVVIGGSAGAIEVLREIVAALPGALDASVFVVVHLAEDSARPGLAALLARHAQMPCDFAVDQAPIASGRIYIAPPGRHMTVTASRVRVIDGPRENGFRPAVDPLFRTAAVHHGGSVIGVILSGARDDGSAGLATIKQHGGRAIVQSPEDSSFPSMPESALALVTPDDLVPAGQIAARIVARVEETTGALATDPVTEVDMSSTGRNDQDPRVRSWDAFRCPDCGGVLRELAEGPMQRFQCRTGHAYSIESLLASQADGVEAALWSAVNVLREREDMSRRLAEHATKRGLRFASKRYLREAQTSADQAQRIVEILRMAAPLPIERAAEHDEEE